MNNFERVVESYRVRESGHVSKRVVAFQSSWECGLFLYVSTEWSCSVDLESVVVFCRLRECGRVL